MTTSLIIDNEPIPYFDITINNPLQAADTATFSSPEHIPTEDNPKIHILGNHQPFNGFVLKRTETDAGYSYSCMDYTRLLLGKIVYSATNVSPRWMIQKILMDRGISTGGINDNNKIKPQFVFDGDKAIDICHQMANQEENTEFFLNEDCVGVVREIPAVTNGYVFYPPSYSDYSLSHDITNIITGVTVLGESGKQLIYYQDQDMIAQYGDIQDLLNDSNIKTTDEARVAALNRMREKGKVEFSGSITTPILEKIKAGSWIILVPPVWSKNSIKAYYPQEVRTYIGPEKEEQQIDLLDGQPAPPSEWIYNAPGQTEGTVSGSISVPAEIIYSISDPVALKANELGDPRSIRRWIDANIQYEFYYDFKYNPVQVLQYRKGNCYDQSLLMAQMCQAVGYQAYRRCGQVCNGYAHCDCMVYIDGRWVQADVTCASRNQLI